MSFYRKSFEIIGYTYDADVHCVECACKYVAANYPKRPVEHDDFQGFGNWSMGTYGEEFTPEIFDDSEGNGVHPIFLDAYVGFVQEDDDGNQYPPACSDCGEEIE